ncbi:MAG: helix-turn-helix transcriptional regulator [Eubacterium sp.]|nr:helix-turn-helix transcriptional regulator [Eubacterium sp.]
MSFGNNLRTLIEERNLTQKELAKKLNIAPSTMGSYVQNTREPDFNTLKLFAEYFDVSTDYLLDHNSNQTFSHQEDELLRIFRSLSSTQKDICIEQCKAFVKINYREKEETAKSS